MKTKSGNAIRNVLLVTILVVGMFGAFVAGTATGFMARPALAADEPTQFDVFWEVWELVGEHFVDQDRIDPERMTYGAVRGMLATLGDEGHTAFFSPEEAIQQQDQLEGSFEGIGAYVEQKDGLFRIVAPIHGSPAEAAGILAGDIVLSVDGEDIAGLPDWEIISKIRGPQGTDVILTVVHPETTKPVNITVTRGNIDTESVTWSRIPETDLAYLKVSQFADDTGAELEKALRAIEEEGNGSTPIKGILLDLRNNPGGYFPELLRLNNQFLDNGKTIVHQRNAQGETRSYQSVGNGIAREIPLVVLINQGTASAGEITAAALQENDRAILIGETTFGTGTVLQSFPLSDGSVVRIGVTNWLTPDERLIKGQGVKPDIEFPQEMSVTTVDTYAIEGVESLQELFTAGDKQFNLGVLQLRLLAQ